MVSEVDKRIDVRLMELADLLQKREALKLLYRHLQRECAYHPNCKTWLCSIERSIPVLDRRIEFTMHWLQLGV